MRRRDKRTHERNTRRGAGRIRTIVGRKYTCIRADSAGTPNTRKPHHHVRHPRRLPAHTIQRRGPSAPRFSSPAHHSADLAPSRRRARIHGAHREVRWCVSCHPVHPPSSLTAGTMFELVKALNDGAQVLRSHSANPISLNAGCELFITFVTLFPHDSDVRFFHSPCPTDHPSPQNFTDLKRVLIRQGQSYATEALTYRQKIAELAVGFIKDGSVVRLSAPYPRRLHNQFLHQQILTHSYSRVVMQTLLHAHKQKRISGIPFPSTCHADCNPSISLCHRSTPSRSGVYAKSSCGTSLI